LSKTDNNSTEPTNQEFTELQDIIGKRNQEQIGAIQDDLKSVQQLIEEDRLLLDRVQPLFPELLEKSLNYERERMLSILSPFLFPLIQRAAMDAVRGFANRIDAQIQGPFSIRDVPRRIWAKLQGVSYSEIILREGLNFKVDEIFLIHYETGLLLYHVSRTHQNDSDSELISGMLTAIRDFAQTTLTKDNNSGITLDGIETSFQEILIEVDGPIYMAVVMQGLNPSGFRDRMRQLLNEVNQTHREILADYNGDSSLFAHFENSLLNLMQDE